MIHHSQQQKRFSVVFNNFKKKKKSRFSAFALSFYNKKIKKINKNTKE